MEGGEQRLDQCPVKFHRSATVRFDPWHKSRAMSPTKVFLSIARGDAEAHAIRRKAHQDVADWLFKNSQTYGLPDSIGSLDEVQRETLQSLYEGQNVRRLLTIFARDAYGCFAGYKVARERMLD